MKIVLLTFLPLLVSNWAIMADEGIETQQLNHLQKELEFEELYRKTDIQNLRASGALSSDEMYREIDPTSCHRGIDVCDGAGGDHGNSVIKAGSCNNGTSNCNWTGYSGNSTIGVNSCNGGRYKCSGNGYMGDAVIGDNSCNSEADYEDFYADSCIGNGAESNKKAIIGNNACNAIGACEKNKGIIGDGCCNYKNACQRNEGEIKLGSKECGATAVPTPSPTICTKICTKHHWTSCAYFPKCPSGYKKIYERNGPCLLGTKRFVCEKRYHCNC